MATFDELLTQSLKNKKENGLYRELFPPAGISFCHNDYLGLSQDERLKRASVEAIEVYGVGSGGSRLLGGNHSFMENIESEFAETFGSPACLFFSSGYLANLASVAATSLLVDQILSDEKNHASLIDGIRLSGKPKKIFPHLSWKRELLDSGKALTVSESLFSMDGDVLPTEMFLSFFESKENFVLIDEAHAVGIFEKEGLGLLSHKVPDWNRCNLTLTFGKAFGMAGACILCSKEMKELILNEARTFIYTTAPPPAMFFQSAVALSLLRSEGWRREELWSRAKKVRGIIRSYGVKTLGEERSPIIPILIGDGRKALQMAKNMREKGIDLRAIRFPTVSIGEERIRLSLSLLQSEENTMAMAEEIGRLCQEFS